MSSDLKVPILVSSDPAVASDPIIGYNVIEAIINRNEGKTQSGRKHLAHKVSKAFTITVRIAHNVVQSSGSGPETGMACTGGKMVPLPANEVSTVYIWAHVSSQARSQDMLFSPDILNPPPEGVAYSKVLVRIAERKVPYIPIPVTNTTDHTIYLDRHKVEGYLESVKTVYAATVQTKESKSTPESKDSTEIKSSKASNTPKPDNEQVKRPTAWDPPVDLQLLPEGQQEAVRRVLREECEAFAFDSDDVGSIPTLKMHITLNDTHPVRKTYMSVPKPLHNEVKEYLQDLLNKGWITPS